MPTFGLTCEMFSVRNFGWRLQAHNSFDRITEGGIETVRVYRLVQHPADIVSGHHVRHDLQTAECLTES